jgi:serine/threonine-protein kinase
MPRRTIGGRYELEQPLGGGAMSSVWLAHDAELDRKVAVKLLASDADRARFEREAHAVAALAHPNICQLYDYGESDDGPYMVLEYLPGGTLEDRLKTVAGPLPDDEALRISQEVAAGLAHAHERGLVHRDLKPANILFDAEQRAKIADFGIARIEGGNALTVAGTVLGTAAYLSPEQAAGLPASPASDVYSFGVIVFRMLTGRPPFVADGAMELVRLHQEAEPPQVEELRPDAPPTLASLAFASLAKDPAQRPADGDALLAALTGSTDATMLMPPPAEAALAVAAAEGATQVIRTPRPARGRTRALPLVAVAAALALGVAGVAAAVLLSGSSDDGATTPTGAISLPSVGRATTSDRSTTSTVSATVVPVTSSSSTSSTSSTRETTTAPATTAPPATTSAPPPVTTEPVTTEPVTTAPPPPTTTFATTTTADTTTFAATTTTATP